MTLNIHHSTPIWFIDLRTAICTAVFSHLSSNIVYWVFQLSASIELAFSFIDSKNRISLNHQACHHWFWFRCDIGFKYLFTFFVCLRFFFTLRQMFKNYMKMIRVWLKHEYFVWSKNWVRICGFRNENVLLNCSFIKYAYFHLLAITFAVTYVRWVTSSYVARRIKIYSSSDGNSDILTACELSGLGNKRWFMHVNNIILHKQLARQEVIVHSMGSGFSEFDSNHVFYTC